MHQTTTIMLYFLHFIWKVEGNGGDARKQEEDSIPFKVHFLAVEAEADRAVRLDDAARLLAWQQGNKEGLYHTKGSPPSPVSP